MTVVRDSIVKIITRRAERLAPEDAAITEASTLDSLGFDSIDRLSLGYGLEEDFDGFDAEATDWSDRTTIGQIADQIAKLAERGNGH